MSLRVRLILSFGSILIVMLITSGLTIRNLTCMNDEIESIDSTWIPVATSIQNTYALLFSARGDLSAITTLHDPKEVENYNVHMTVLLRRIGDSQKIFAIALENMPQSDRKQAILDITAQIEAQSGQFATMRKDLLTFIRAGKNEEAAQLLANSRTPFLRLADLYEQIVSLSNEGANLAITRARGVSEQSIIFSSGLSLVAVLIGITVILLLLRVIHRQLGEDPGELDNIARRVAQGDYDLDNDTEKRGVYASIIAMVQALKIHIESAQRESLAAREQSDRATEALRQTKAANTEAQNKSEALKVAAAKLQDVTHVVSESTARLAAQIEQSDKGTHETTGRLSEAASAMQQMNATVQEVARNASIASQASTETRAKAENGSEIVKRSLRSIDQVHKASMTLKDDMAQLREHTQDINRIMGVISDIADQTNLLALNAAIEAARAGEAGRGFAVVADEVRKLAEKTMASTQDVASAIEAIQSSAAQSMDSVDRAAKQIEEANIYASQSGAALADIVATVESTADQVNAIAAASEQQSATSDEVSGAITQISEMARQTSEAMSEAAKAITNLSAQASNLMQLVEAMNHD
ncbi:MAG TPA: methyl-accepting chemotaxis protein [Desulfovibrio sp.]|uniref:methyl-accepting chemotaxis protein n=1 Tax=Desulfovibrio sp. TaxID=885 RepID=UPI002D64F7F8|nr:methyl-accepting chemotaxis protein [Desulfovibrio sp.]HZF60630.1 methyl-accepting chemotaxis protein [Desulfovibrio sp.]